MTRYTVKNTPESLLFWQFLAMTQSSMTKAITHIPLWWGANRWDKPQMHLHICKGPTYATLLTMLRQSHLSTKTPEQSSKAIQKKAFISTSEQSWPIIEEYLAVGCGFLVQTRYSCHLKSGDSRTTPICQLKLVWKKKPKCQHKNYGKWLRVLQHRPVLTCELWECEIQSRRCYT